MHTCTQTHTHTHTPVSLVHMPRPYNTPQLLDLLVPLLECFVRLFQLLCLHFQVSVQVLTLYTALGALQGREGEGGEGKGREGRRGEEGEGKGGEGRGREEVT